MNARETLAHAADWLGRQDENLSFGLRNAFDALRLYDYAQAHPDLHEFADSWKEKDFIAAIGYNPFKEPGHEATTSGADKVAVATDKAHAAMTSARTLLDSVAFVYNEGDTTAPIAALDDALMAINEVAKQPEVAAKKGAKPRKSIAQP